MTTFQVSEAAAGAQFGRAVSPTDVSSWTGEFFFFNLFRSTLFQNFAHKVRIY